MSKRLPHYAVKSLCELFGISRQGFYKYKVNKTEITILTHSILLYCHFLRQEENLPKAGARELYELNRLYFNDKFTIGRDKFYMILRHNGLMHRKRKYHPRTTNSNHPLRIYDDLVNTIPKFVPRGNGSLIVADITYVKYKDGFAYLSLLTDAYSRCVVGHCLFKTLETAGPLSALKKALAFYREQHISIRELIHHSDRGIQYASADYIRLLKENQIRISMTQTGDPLDNALAERMNNTLKNGWLFKSEQLSFEQLEHLVDRAVYMYNAARPHQSLEMKTPLFVATGNNQNAMMAYSPAQ